MGICLFTYGRNIHKSDHCGKLDIYHASLFCRWLKIDLGEIHRTNLFAHYGSRTAIFLFYYQKNKDRHFYIPKFKNNPAYIAQIVAVQKRVESNYPPAKDFKDNQSDFLQLKTKYCRESHPLAIFNPPSWRNSFNSSFFNWDFWYKLLDFKYPATRGDSCYRNWFFKSTCVFNLRIIRPCTPDWPVFDLVFWPRDHLEPF